MKSAPDINFKEFAHYQVSEADVNGFSYSELVHPDFGSWKYKIMDLGNICISEHQVALKEKVNIQFDDSRVDAIHHCMLFDGAVNTVFSEKNSAAPLTAKSFHAVYLPSQEYILDIDSIMSNVHVEITRDCYLSFLSDSEKWSAELKKKLFENEVYNPGELKLSMEMVQTIHSIFNSPLSGSLKKLLIEAKVHELIALQLYQLFQPKDQKKSAKGNVELFHAVKEYLDQSFLESLSLGGISKHFGINDFTLKKGFKENFNKTVFDYVLERRLEYGMNLLRNTDQAIQQISSVVGYKYPNHFSAAFKKRFGVNPTEVRK